MLVVIATAPVACHHLFTCLFILKVTSQKYQPLFTLANGLVPGEDRQAVRGGLGDTHYNPFGRNHDAQLQPAPVFLSGANLVPLFPAATKSISLTLGGQLGTLSLPRNLSNLLLSSIP